MKEVLERNNVKPQHIFISAMIVDIVIYLLWHTIKIFDPEVADSNYFEIILSIIDLAAYSFSLYFLIWIESRINEKKMLRFPVYGLILSLVIQRLAYFYPIIALPANSILIYIPGLILMVILISFLIKKKGVYSSEFKFIGITFLVSLVVMLTYPVMFAMITTQYPELISFNVISEIIQLIMILPKIAILMLTIKSLKEFKKEETEVLENY
ncbi:MAG: hypothetical protein J7604_21230 [Sporocytophaga sp.]|uniref:hypothetical protein n=1 Tax=Sporocytophaga sp. TaxID=2231183 RepID=UPI001B107D97|nr:hypothetical protein [Sporocytophaga sp.]MBO9702749.1 hypothetical protein [Sporocytophaga sp.]